MSEDAREMYRPPRLSPTKSKLCDICASWGDHFADDCPSLDASELAAPDFVADLLAQARQSLKGGK